MANGMNISGASPVAGSQIGGGIASLLQNRGQQPQQNQQGGSAQSGSLASGLQALGAGIQGNLPQFKQVQQREQALQQEQQQAQREAQQEMLEKRTEAAYEDAQIARHLAEQGNWEGVASVGLQRLQALQQFPGADPTDTQVVTNLATAAAKGDEDAQKNLIGELDNILEMGRIKGYVERPEEDTYTLSPGETRFRGGEEVASVPETQQGELDDKEKQAQLLQSQFVGQGMEPQEAAQEAANRVYDNVRVEMTDQGYMRMTDLTTPTPTVTEIPVQAAGQKQEQQEKDTGQDQSQSQGTEGQTDIPTGNRATSLYGISDNVSGFGATTRALSGKIKSMFGAEMTPEEAQTSSNRSTARFGMQNLIDALALSDRRGITEQEAIRQKVTKNIMPKLTSGGGELRAELGSLDEMLRSNLRRARQAAEDPTKSRDFRQDAEQTVSTLENAIDLVGYVDADRLRGPDDVYQAPLKSLEQFVESADEETLNNLPDDVYESMVERLQNARSE